MKNSEQRISLNIANPNPLGYAALGTLLWVHGMISSGIFPESYGMLGEEVSTVFVICALLIAGIVAFLKSWTWDGTLFLYWSAMEFGWVQARDHEVSNEAFLSHIWLAVAIFHVFLVWKAFQKENRNLFRGLIASDF